MLVMLLGRVIEVSDVQLPNVAYPMLLMPSGIVTEVCVAKTCDTVGDDDRGEVGAVVERTIPNACDAARNGDGGEPRTRCQGIIANMCDGVIGSVIIYCGWDGNRGEIVVVTAVPRC